MADLKYRPVAHDHEAFVKKAMKRKGFREAYESLEVEYRLVGELLAARAKAGLTQEEVARSMGTTKSVVSRLESAGKHSPSVTTLKRYAKAVGYDRRAERLRDWRNAALRVSYRYPNTRGQKHGSLASTSCNLGSHYQNTRMIPESRTLCASIYPGYTVSQSAGSVIVGALYALLDGAVGGLIFGCLYNLMVGGKAAVSE